MPLFDFNSKYDRITELARTIVTKAVAPCRFGLLGFAAFNSWRLDYRPL